MDDFIGVHYEIDIAKLKNSMDKAKTELDRFNQKISKAAQQVSAPRGMIQGYAGVGAELKKMGISATTTTKQFEGMNFTALEHTKIAKLTKVQMGNLEKSIEKTGVATGAASKQYDRLSKRLEHSQYQIRQQAGAMGDARRAQERWSATGMKAMFLSQTAWLASGAVIFGVLSTIRTGIQNFMDFNQGLVDAAAITQATSAGFEQMRKAAMGAFTSSTMGAKEATDALKILGQAGMDATDAAIALETVYKVTTATGGATTDVVKFLTTALNVWNLSAKDAAEVGNILGAALNYSKLEVEDLTTVFNYVASMAKSAGMSITELAATLAVMANAGIKASTIGTGLRGVFTKLIATTPKFEKQLRSVGLTVDDVSLVTNDFFTVLKRLQDAKFDMPKIFKGMTRREAASLNVILEQGVERFKLMEKALTDTTAVEVMFERSMMGMKNQIILTGHQIQAVFIDALKYSQPIIIKITQTIRALIDAIRQLSPILLGVGAAFMAWKVWGVLMISMFTEVAAKATFLNSILMFLSRHPIFASITLLITGFAAVKAIIDATTVSVKEHVSQLNREIDDLSKLQILMMDVNKTDEEKLDILANYAKDYNILLPLLSKEKFMIEDVIELTSKENKERKEKIRLLKEEELARLKSELSRRKMAKEAATAEIGEPSPWMQKLQSFFGLGFKETIGDLEKQIKTIQLELDRMAGKGPKIEKPKVKFEFTEEMIDAVEKMEYDLANARKQAEIDLEENLAKFGIVEGAKTKLTTEQIHARETAYKTYNKKLTEIKEEELKTATEIYEKTEKLEKEFRDTQFEQTKRAMEATLDEHEYRQWLAEAEFEREKENNRERTKAIEKYRDELKKTYAEAEIKDPALLKQIEQLDLLIKKWRELGLIKKEDAKAYDPKDMVGGFKKGVEEMVTAWTDGYALMKDFARDAFQSIQSSFSDIVYDNMIGELKSINDYWKVLKNAILRHIADIATKMIISGIMGTAAKKFDWLGSFMTLAGAGLSVGAAASGASAMTAPTVGFDPNVAINMPGTGHTGGMISGNSSNSFKAFSDAIRMHSGGEVMRILKKGEYVMQDSAAKSIGRGNLDQMNRTGQIPQPQPQIIDRRTTINYIQAIDAASFEQTLREKGGRAIYDMSLNSYSAARGKRDPRVINR